jgi:hypothetical protein
MLPQKGHPRDERHGIQDSLQLHGQPLTPLPGQSPTFSPCRHDSMSAHQQSGQSQHPVASHAHPLFSPLAGSIGQRKSEILPTQQRLYECYGLRRHVLDGYDNILRFGRPRPSFRVAPARTRYTTQSPNTILYASHHTTHPLLLMAVGRSGLLTVEKHKKNRGPIAGSLLSRHVHFFFSPFLFFFFLQSSVQR